uniref:Pinin_SDK_memA domain-containing protein n=1 Tax=Trichuris muris TaxID=70415 RepID=A0A5S6QY31_TRIMR
MLRATSLANSLSFFVGTLFCVTEMAAELATVVSDYDAKLNQAWEHMHALEDDFKKLTGRSFGRPRGGGTLPTRGRGGFSTFHRRPVPPPAPPMEDEIEYGPQEQSANEWTDRRSRFGASTRAGFRSRPAWNARREEEFVEYAPPLGKRRFEDTERPYGPAPPDPENRHYQRDFSSRDFSWREVPESNFEKREEWSRGRPLGPRPYRMQYEEPQRRGYGQGRNEDRQVDDYSRSEFKYGQRRLNRPFTDEARRSYRRRESPQRLDNQDEKTEQEDPAAKIQRRSKISPITFSESSPPRDNSPPVVHSRASPIHKNEREAAKAIIRDREPKEVVDRNRRFFGMMMNTLRTFDSEGPKGFEVQAQKMKAVGARLEAEREAERKRIAEEKQKIIENRRRQRMEIRRLQRKRGIVMVHESEICHMKRLQSFIITVAQPQICYLPAKHTIRTMELHKKSQRVLEENIAKVREDMKVQLKEVDAMDNVDAEEAEEEAHSPENEYIDENPSVFDHIEVTDQFQTEVSVEGETDLLMQSSHSATDLMDQSTAEVDIHETEDCRENQTEMEVTEKNDPMGNGQTQELPTAEEHSEVDMSDTKVDEEGSSAVHE